VTTTIFFAMFNRAVITLFCSAFFSIACYSQTQSKKNEKPDILFKVNKRPVPVNEFIYLYNKNHQDREKDFTEQKINEYLELFINFKLKVEEARRRKLDTTKVFLKEYNGYREELRKPYLPDANMVDSLVRLTYSRQQEEINASHILIALKPDASPADTAKAYAEIMELRNRVVSGEDFSKVAAQHSNDPSAKTNGGNLGYFTAMQMVYPFETAAYTTSVGNVSQPIRTKYGYHILKVSDRRPARQEVEVSHIMLRTGRDKDNDKIKNSIFNLHDQLRAGVSWAELCSQYSEDANTKDDGGKLQPFGTGGMSAVPEFERIAFGLNETGEISDPFQTQYGWHILRLERKIPRSTFEEAKTSLRSKVTRDERTELSKQDLQKKLRKEHQFVENADGRSVLMSMADSSLQRAKWNPPVSAEEGKKTVFVLSGIPHSIADVVAFVKTSQLTTKLAPGTYLEQLYNDFIDKRITELVEEKIMKENPDYKFLLQEYYEGILLFEIMEKEVWGKASQDSAGQRSYFLSHQADFTSGERVLATLFSSNTAGFREPLQKLIADGIESSINTFVTQNRIKTETGYFEKDGKPVLRAVPWAKGVHSAENNGIYYLAWLKDILPAGLMSFEEARPGVISDYQGFLEKKWISQLKKKYRVKVNGKAKQYILQQLQVKR
jgi:peptidyl-prolyl cis-trans isomerase SurA